MAKLKTKDSPNRNPTLVDSRANSNSTKIVETPTLPITGNSLKSNDRVKGTNNTTQIREKRKATITDNKVHLVNVSSRPYSRLTIQGMPSEIECNPETTWAAIRSPGRNSPFYNYTGSEDTITFDITWYANNPNNREDVINKCRLLESWSKADGYKASPPIIEIVWGKSGIFAGHSYILKSAKYKLGNFQNSFKEQGSSLVVDAKLLPNYAIQSLVFNRVSNINLTSEDIVSRSKLSTTPGIKLE